MKAVAIFPTAVLVDQGSNSTLHWAKGHDELFSVASKASDSLEGPQMISTWIKGKKEEKGLIDKEELTQGGQAARSSIETSK